MLKRMLQSISSTSALVNSEATPSEVFLSKGVLKICNKFTGEHPCESVNKVALHLY